MQPEVQPTGFAAADLGLGGRKLEVFADLLLFSPSFRLSVLVDRHSVASFSFVQWGWDNAGSEQKLYFSNQSSRLGERRLGERRLGEPRLGERRLGERLLGETPF